jgi:hypothetical protein
MKKVIIILLIGILISPVLIAQDTTNEKPVRVFGKNNLSLFLSDVVMKRLSFEYEHIMGENGNMSINIPASYSIGTMEDIYGDETQWWIGMGMKLYPTGQGVIRYYFGPEVRVMGAYRLEDGAYYDYETGINLYQPEEYDLVHSAFLLNNGMIYEPTENFIFTVNLGLGFVSRDAKDPGFYPMATPSVRMGIRF